VLSLLRKADGLGNFRGRRMCATEKEEKFKRCQFLSLFSFFFLFDFLVVEGNENTYKMAPPWPWHT
jgi:hypothetical protein